MHSTPGVQKFLLSFHSHFGKKQVPFVSIDLFFGELVHLCFLCGANDVMAEIF